MHKTWQNNPLRRAIRQIAGLCAVCGQAQRVNGSVKCAECRSKEANYRGTVRPFRR